ncbi:glycosyltransferase, partial [Paracraurococcus ruber]
PRPPARPAARDAAARPAAPPTRISVIACTRDGGALLRDALSSLAARAAEPALLEALVVDNGSTAPETLAILAEGEARGRFRVLRRDEPFNWSRLNTLAARQATGDILLFLNDDTRMLTDGWDRILRRLLAEPEVGAVGARLLYEDRTIQHAGVLCGLEGLVGHDGVGAAAEAPGPLGRWQVPRQAGAVTGAFLACRRAAFDAVGGFDAQALPVSFNDVDLCLKLRAAGLAVLYEPRIALLHYESKSRGHDDADPAKQERAEAEQARLRERWGEALLLDPGWNPHWSRWTKPFAALREPSPAEIARHLAASCRADPWSLAG